MTEVTNTKIEQRKDDEQDDVDRVNVEHISRTLKRPKRSKNVNSKDFE